MRGIAYSGMFFLLPFAGLLLNGVDGMLVGTALAALINFISEIARGNPKRENNV